MSDEKRLLLKRALLKEELGSRSGDTAKPWYLRAKDTLLDFNEALNRGLTFGFSDELEGAVAAATGGDYTGSRDRARERQRVAEERSPKAAMTGDILGGLVQPAGKIGKGFKAAVGGIGRSAGEGAVAGLGYGEGDVGQQLGSAKTGAMFGGGITGLGQAGQKIGKAAFETVTRLDEDIINKYLNRSKQINKARSIQEMATVVPEKVQQLQKRVWEGSKQATEVIPDDVVIDANKIRGPIVDSINKIESKTFTPESKATVNQLRSLLDAFDEKFGKSKIDEPISGKEVKNIIKDLDRSTKRPDFPGQKMEPVDVAKAQIRGRIDKALKTSSPEYAEAMRNVAADTAAHSRAQKYFKDPGRTEPKIKGIGRGPEGRLGEREALSRLDSRLGSDLTGEVEDAMTARSFNLDQTRGSKGMGLGAFMLGGAGYMAGDGEGAGGGTMVGALLGAMSDRYGRRMGKLMMDQYIAAKAARQKPPAGLIDAMRRAVGGAAMQSNPRAGALNAILSQDLDQ